MEAQTVAVTFDMHELKMSKTKIICNHCNQSIEWYLSAIDETDYRQIGKKYYCGECLHLLAKEFIG